jgi:alcohol dehydrogenase
VPFSDNVLQPIPDGLRDEQVILAGDILPTAYSALAGLAPGGRGVREGDNVVVFGLGPVGLCAVASAKMFKPAKVIAADIQTDRLTVAKALGADEAVDASDKESVRATIRRLTDGWGADYVVEAVGRQESLANSVAVAAPGGVVAVLGAFQEPTTINAPRMQARNVTVIMGMGDLGRMKELLEAIAAGSLDVTGIVTHRMSLDEAIKAYEMFDRKQDGAIKILLCA